MNQLWGPALDAELEYRRERAAQAYGSPSWWARLRDRAARRHATATAMPTGGATPTAGATPVATARAAASEWDERVARRASQIREALEGLRPQESLDRRRVA
jgi:hypothetical protein